MFKSIQYSLYAFTALLIVAVALTTVLIVSGNYLFSVAGIILMAISLANLRRCYARYNSNIIFLLNALENGDYSYRFSANKLSAREREINQVMNRIGDILATARKEIIENEQFLALILESITTGIVIIDDNGIVHRTNRTAKEMLGLTVFTHVNQLRVIDESYPEMFRRLRAGDSRQLSLTNEKEERPVSLRVSQILLKRGMMRVLTMNNIGNELEMKEMESWIRLIRVMTHEIMNSVAPVTSLSETMLALYRDSTTDSATLRQNTLEAFETINGTASGLLAFVQSYRKFTSVPQPEKKACDLTALVRKAIRLHERQMRDNGITITLSTNEHIVAQADENLIMQVVINLLKNAAEATETTSDRRIIITLAGDETDGASIDFANTGDPIPPDVLPHIFVPFFTTKTDGSGVGLSVSRYIVRLHGGKLTHRLSPDSLTVFRIELPAG
ncbi:MAG: PAS domain S-box protein [Tannerella sp.]|jgi:PAS domain S-box-containing protein|nr:PAS domain S-box protein [Tannerella sp.]